MLKVTDILLKDSLLSKMNKNVAYMVRDIATFESLSIPKTMMLLRELEKEGKIEKKYYSNNNGVLFIKK